MEGLSSSPPNSHVDLVEARGFLDRAREMYADLEKQTAGEKFRARIKEERKRIQDQIELLDAKLHGISSKGIHAIRKAVTGDENKRVRDLVADKGMQGRKAWRKAVTGDAEKRIRDHVKESVPAVRAIDKLSFTFGVILLMVSEFVLIRHPDRFWVLYSIVIPTLCGLRYFLYRKAKWSYFLLDFCYFVQMTCLLQVFLFPNNVTLFKMNFAMAQGPLLWAIIFWRNSLVFHSLDKITSAYIHLLPPLLTYCWRWLCVPEKTPVGDCVGQENLADSCEMSLLESFALPLLGYFVWQVCYYVQTEIIDRAFIESDPDIATSLRWLTRDERGFLHKITLKITRKLGVMGKDEHFDPSAFKTKVIFMSAQCVFTTVFVAPGHIVYHSFAAHTVLIGFVFACLIWNGAAYYIEVFSVKYIGKFEKMKQSENKVEIPGKSSRSASDIGSGSEPISPSTPVAANVFTVEERAEGAVDVTAAATGTADTDEANAAHVKNEDCKKTV